MYFVPLRRDDIAEVMRLERLPGYDAFIGRWEADEHAAQMASPDTKYFGVRGGSGLVGFVIMQDARAPSIRLRRIAAETPGGGLGTHMLRAAMAWVFEATPAASMWLDVHVENGRARHVYEREGLTAEGGHDEVHQKMVMPRERWAELSARR